MGKEQPHLDAEQKKQNPKQVEISSCFVIQSL